MPKKKTAPPALPVIELANLTKIYGYDDTVTHALDGIDLSIEEGEFVAIMGPSGCGKTTLLNILGLLDTPSSGEYALAGRPVAEISHRTRARIRAEQIGFIFQSFNLLSRMNIIDNVALPLSYKRGLRHKRLERASKMLKTFELQEREYFMPSQLSGGQLQRVAIARALVNKPSIILADEPTGNLDSAHGQEVMRLLRELNDEGTTLVMVTHSAEHAALASRTVRLLDGRVLVDAQAEFA